MTGILIFLFGISIGIVLGLWLAWHIWLHSEVPVINAKLVIDPALLTQINAQMTMAWLDKQGLTWMPKGAEFDHARNVKR